MKSRSAIFAIIALLVESTALQAQQKPPVFRAGIDLRQIDVTVRDRHRQPVRDLRPQDFTILEDGKPQDIQSFAFVDVPDAAAHGNPESPRLMAADVTSNELDTSRVFVIIVDDVKGAGDLWAEREMKKGVTAFIAQLGSKDLAALVLPGGSGASQSFTGDRAKLAAALERYNTRPGDTGTACEAERRLPNTLLYAADQLGTLRDKRKVVVYFGAGIAIPNPKKDRCGSYFLWRDVLSAAQRGNVSIYPIDTAGLLPGRHRDNQDYLTVANETGGHALVNANGFDEGLRRIFSENGSFYLLAYEATREPDGRYRRVAVRVNRPDVEVVATRAYQAPQSATDQAAPSTTAGERDALSHLVPMSQLPLRAAAAAFAGEGSDQAVAAITIGVRQRGFVARTSEQVELTAVAISLDGHDLVSDRQLVPIIVPAVKDQDAESRYEIVARLELPGPGRYEVRLAVESQATDARGSVYVDVNVPDFRHDKLSLSGVIVNALPADPTAPERPLGDLTPIAPTTERAFLPSQTVTAFLRIYQGGDGAVSPVALTSRILDSAGKAVAEQSTAIGIERFSVDRSAEFRFRVPMDKLDRGDYRLTLEASQAGVTVGRDVVFSVRRNEEEY